MGRHRFDPISMIFGVLFAVIGGAFLFGNIDVATLPPALSWPVPLVVLGLVIISLALSGSRPDRRETPVVAAAAFGGEPANGADEGTGVFDEQADGETGAPDPHRADPADGGA
jgi:hypothetical protein